MTFALRLKLTVLLVWLVKDINSIVMFGAEELGYLMSLITQRTNGLVTFYGALELTSRSVVV